jgi:hypothetical protein
MRGSLDNPPIIIVTSRSKFLLVLATCVAFMVSGIFMVRDGRTDGYWIAGFFGLGVIVALWRVRIPARLELSPEHLLWFTGNKTIRFRWVEIQEFVAWHPVRSSTQVGIIFAPGSRLDTSATGFMLRAFDVSGSLGGSWEIKTSDLIRMLNTARERWGSR